MIGAILCGVGLHKWRDCKRAVWETEYALLTLDLCACARCGEVRRQDAEQLAYLAPLTPYRMRVDEVQSHD